MGGCCVEFDVVAGEELEDTKDRAGKLSSSWDRMSGTGAVQTGLWHFHVLSHSFDPRGHGWREGETRHTCKKKGEEQGEVQIKQDN